mmetsp:Transcript_13323/g.31790  ORF Transcript_13323/g.31790 Transcript_13323/m.31790 type:complete len:235 (+) Transcript_13323:1381-2085(+)
MPQTMLTGVEACSVCSRLGATRPVITWFMRARTSPDTADSLSDGVSRCVGHSSSNGFSRRVCDASSRTSTLDSHVAPPGPVRGWYTVRLCEDQPVQGAIPSQKHFCRTTDALKLADDWLLFGRVSTEKTGASKLVHVARLPLRQCCWTYVARFCASGIAGFLSQESSPSSIVWRYENCCVQPLPIVPVISMYMLRRCGSKFIQDSLSKPITEVSYRMMPGEAAVELSTSASFSW